MVEHFNFHTLPLT